MEQQTRLQPDTPRKTVDIHKDPKRTSRNN
jgi:hypothetical protein